MSATQAKATWASGTAPRWKSRTTAVDTVVRLTAVAYAATIAIAWKSYMRQGRLLAEAPVVESLAQLPAWCDQALLGLQITALAWLVLRPRSKAATLLSLACTALWILQDAGRLQPPTYMFCAALAFAAAAGPNQAIGPLRTMVAGTYFWAGLWKANMTFWLATFPWFISGIRTYRGDHGLGDTAQSALGLMVPFLEAAIGLLLIPRSTRTMATIMAGCMLLVVTASIGPTGLNWNKGVWPWNWWLAGIEVLLFTSLIGPTKRSTTGRWIDGPVGWCALALFCVLPGLTGFGLWPAYLGFELYSGNTATANISLGEAGAHGADARIAAATVENNVSLLDLSMAEYGYATSPEPWILRAAAKGLCGHIADPGAAVLRLSEPPPPWSHIGVVYEEPLCPTQNSSATPEGPASATAITPTQP